MTHFRARCLVLSAILCLSPTAATFAQPEEKAPAALWTDFSAAVKGDLQEPARDSASQILASRKLDDTRFAKLIDDDPDHNALFAQGLKSEKVHDATVRILERYTSIKSRPKLAPYWLNFIHYVRIARPDAAQAEATNLLAQLPTVTAATLTDGLADAGGAALAQRVEDQTLLDIVESREYPDFDVTLQRAARIATLKDLSEKIQQKIQDARINRSRDHDRIVTDIQRLSEGERANLNAITRLRAAGQFAAPELLAALLDERRAKLQPFVLAAMVSIGRPVVYPLSVALPNLEAVPQGQVAQVLAEIGYPRALPYLKLVLDNPKTDANTRTIVETAYKQISRNMNLPKNVTAAELFLTLGQNYYNSGSTGDTLMGFDPAAGKGVAWSYDRAAGLIDSRVPVSIFADVLAMRASRQALDLNPKLDAAMSLWLMSNLRRENRLAKGEVDPSYPTNLQPPAFYLGMAGPLRQHDVLNRALEDSDTALALDAIGALSQTAGTDALVNRAGTAQPLLRALTYPDRRVRFAAAFALTNAQPKSEFPGSFRVVPVLAEAVRQTDVRYAVVIGKDTDSLNRLAGAVSELQPHYEAIPGTNLNAVAEPIGNGPGVDLIVTNQSLEQVVSLYRQSAADYKLAAVPIVALVSPGDQIELSRRFDRDPRLRPVAMTEDAKQLKPALEQAVTSYAGAAINAEEAEQFALTSLHLLRSLALNTSNVFKVGEAEPALVRALNDIRPQVAIDAAAVLSLLDSGDAQRALADAALDATQDPKKRVPFIVSLTESATRFGSKLNEVQLGKVLDLVKTAQGDLALPASRLHGALTLPTSNVAQLIEAAK
ncbi:MAG: hypothetical protein NTW19_13380 [Planctomycetota bacterium]|nr:hypothetical protein [Planctomycetota bacterium]